MEFLFFLCSTEGARVATTCEDHFSFHANGNSLPYIHNHRLSPFKLSVAIKSNRKLLKPGKQNHSDVAVSCVEVSVETCNQETARLTDCATSRPITAADGQQVTLHFNYEKVRPGFVCHCCALCD